MSGELPAQSQVDEIFQDLVVSVLAVNNYSLGKAYGLCGRLREQGLLDVSVLCNDPPGAADIRRKLIAAGYIRGEYVETLISQRIERILGSIKQRGLTNYLLSLDCDPDLLAQRMHGLYGVGPRVVSNFIQLREAARPQGD